MYLQVLHLSDLTTGTGDWLLTNNWRAYKPLQSEYTWPKAAKASNSDWYTWELALDKAFQAGHNQWLPNPLGNYLHMSNHGMVLRHDRTIFMVCQRQKMATPWLYSLKIMNKCIPLSRRRARTHQPTAQGHCAGTWNENYPHWPWQNWNTGQLPGRNGRVGTTPVLTGLAVGINGHRKFKQTNGRNMEWPRLHG